ncbi:hypothetical protein HMPREF9120_01491 [Neisseria sp. oral taxon 020 str. F0370]|nr:hypothetical protein HMPREF9120_01491 [Neisseria sp. oral taxon 020 str. F0370]
MAFAPNKSVLITAVDKRVFTDFTGFALRIEWEWADDTGFVV